MTVIDAPGAATTDALWMLNSLMVERATAADTGGTLTVHEQWVTAAGNPPLHVHDRQDELFLVVEGEIEVTLGDRSIVVPSGSVAFGPRGVPHTYAVRDGVAHLYVVSTPSGLEDFFREVGDPAAALALPEPSAADVPTVVATAARHGITILPPPA
jgi:mannose-6-phosphate isomerase-like protein (cupin superfamily)